SQGARKLDALLRAEGQADDGRIRDRSEIERLDQRIGAGGEPRLLARDQREAQRIGEEPAANAAMATDQDVLAHRQGAKQREILKGAANAERRHAVPRFAQEVAPLEEDAAAFRLVEPAHAVEKRGLARAIGADQAADLSSRDLEGNAIERHYAAEADRQRADGEQRQVASGGFDGHLGRSPQFAKRNSVGDRPAAQPGSRPCAARPCGPFFVAVHRQIRIMGVISENVLGGWRPGWRSARSNSQPCCSAWRKRCASPRAPSRISRLASRRGIHPKPDFTMSFKTAALGTKLLTPPIDWLEQINALKDFKLTMEGDEDLSNWFAQTVMMLQSVRWKLGTRLPDGTMRYCNMTNGGPVFVYVKDGKILRMTPIEFDDTDPQPWTIAARGMTFTPPRKTTLAPHGQNAKSM